MPYFFSDTWKDIKQRSECYADLINGPKYCCSESPETLGQYFPLTLDEYCNPVLPTKILDRRNKDQVFVRARSKEDRGNRKISWRTEKKAPGAEDISEQAKLVTVHQAWLWKVYDILITVHSGDGSGDVSVPDLPERAFKSAADAGPFRIGVVLSFLVDFLDRPVMAGLPEPIFNVFERSIIVVSEDVKQYSKSLDVEDISIEEEQRYFQEIGNIREELAMIKSVLGQQEEVWKEFASNAWPELWPNGQEGRMSIPPNFQSLPREEKDDWRFIMRPQTQFHKFGRRIAKLDDDAERVEKSIATMLDLKQKHATLREAHSAAVMGAAVFGFTIITIVFTPLSFVASLFALPIDRFQQSQTQSRFTDEAGMYSTNYIAKWAGECTKILE